MLLKTLKSLRISAIAFLRVITRTSYGDVDRVMWVTIRTTNLRWEAELLEEVLIAHAVPTRLVALGVGCYLGQGSPAALQVPCEVAQTALHLLKPLEETVAEEAVEMDE